MTVSHSDAPGLRQRAREALQQARFEDLDQMPGELEQRWLEGGSLRYGYGCLLSTRIDPAQALPARLQQARDRDTVDLRRWQLNVGLDTVPDRHDVQPV